MTVECKLCRELRYKGYFRDFCKKQKSTPQYDFTSEEKPGKCWVRVSSIRELTQLARHLKTDLIFFRLFDPLQVRTNISSHITQPVKCFFQYVMMCLFGQLHIREKSILTYVFLKVAMSSVKGYGLVYCVSNANYNSFSP